MTAYHLGSAKCLLEHGYLNYDPKSKHQQSDDEPKRSLLTGVSGGALAVAAVASGVNPEVGMALTLNVAKRTRLEGFLDAFQPG